MASLYFSAQLRAIEAQFADQPLMSRAGLAAAELARRINPLRHKTVLILAGPGNNGGDAFVTASHLAEWGYPVHLLFAGLVANQPRDAQAARQAYLAAGGVEQAGIPADLDCGLIIDGLFGIGLSRAPSAPYDDLIRRANALADRCNCPLLALDCPSGLDADTGRTPGVVIQASHTLNFIGDKPGLHTLEGPDCCGKTYLATLDLDLSTSPAAGRLLALSDFSSCLQTRRRNSHKGSFGSAGLIGGAESMLGAALLAARAALKIGAGRVYCGLLAPSGFPVDPLQPELMLRSAEALWGVQDLAALAIGPGLGRCNEAQQQLTKALSSSLPLVLDADALNLIASQPRLAEQLRQREAATLLTPHPAEAARLLATEVASIQADRIGAALEIARKLASPVVLKGCGSVIAMPNGAWWINPTGNPGMATAGMGDVLSGLIAGLLAQGWPAEHALLGAVHLHGAAADRLVARGLGPIGLTAGEVIDSARIVFNDWVSRAGSR